jgi:SAM-dependent methyltransferase
VSDDWDDIAEWGIDAVRDDPTQSADAHDLLIELLDGTSGRTLDLGCGEGQGMRLVGWPVVGTDRSHALLSRAVASGPVVQARLPDLSWIRDGCIDRAIAVGIVDVIDDHVGFFGHVARAVRPGGHLIVVMNHPVASAPGSAPLVDPDGEVLGNGGEYLVAGSWPQPVGHRTVDLVHRPLGELLTAAAEAGWSLERMIERGPSAAAMEHFAGLRGQGHIPSQLGLRWSRGQPRT